ncbi:MAG: glycosyltransferase family 2 protein [Clostridia bacterium]|nr:glycosyltransferase family 2 protein [Clostridia bacterium]
MDYKISVIIPVFNNENTLPETLDCLLGQSAFKSCQIIIINDGSDDNSADIAERFKSAHSNVIYSGQENNGVSAARNAGISLAEGKYIVFLDADDLISDNKALENLYNAMESAGADAGVFRLRSFGYYGTQLSSVAEELAAEQIISVFDKRLLWNYPVSNKIYRASIIKENNHRFPPTVYTEDGAFWISFIMKCKPKITGIYGAVSEYRQANPLLNMQATQNIKLKTVEDFIRSSKIIEESIGLSFDSGDCECADKDGYIDEQRLRVCQMLLDGFYRKAWQTDNETLEYIGNKYDEYYRLLSKEAKARLEFPDIGIPRFSIKEIGDNPLISVMVKNPSDSFINAVYLQTTPCFEICTGKDIDRENINHGKPKSGLYINFRDDEIPDPRLLSGILKLKARFPYLPPFMLKPACEYYLKHKG